MAPLPPAPRQPCRSAWGDYFRGFRVIGTNAAYFNRLTVGDGRPFAFAAGRNFRDEEFFGGVLGATVAANLGLKPGDFVEIFVKAPLDVCEGRDPKGLYKKARAGEIKGFTGIDDPYEEPTAAELVVDSAAKRPDALAEEVIAWLEEAGLIPRRVSGSS